LKRLEGRGNQSNENNDSKGGKEVPSIRVTHIAGTSAGAIVAALYAARVPMEAVLDRLECLTLDDLLPSFKQFPAIKRASARLLHSLLKFGLRLSSEKRELLARLNVNVGNIALGYSAYNTDGLKEQLALLFNESSQIRYDKKDGQPKWGDFRNVKFERFGTDDSISLSVIRTELRTRKPHTARPDEYLLDFLIDSAAIPFLFRNVNDAKWDLLDGGICANLPSEFLEGSRKMAIGFADPNPERERTGSKWVRTIDLLDAAIDYSVDRSIQLIGKDNCCQLPTLLSTFDFASVVGNGTDIKTAETQSVETATRHFFDKFIARERGERKLNGDPWKLAQSTSAVSEALRRALTKIDSLTPSQFPQKSLKQEFVLHIDPDNPRSTFRAEMHEERLVEAIIYATAPC
jgi:predicted acylesterase/phospholipase RssA